MDIVSDVPYQELPILPVVMTNNFEHGRQAAKRFGENGYTEVCVASWGSVEKQSFQGFMWSRLQGFLSGAKEAGIEATFVQLTAPDSPDKINRFFTHFHKKKGAFSIEMGTNWYLSAQFFQRKIPVRNENFLVYDDHEDFHHYEGLPPIPAIGPSLRTLGRGLANKVIYKWETGSWAEPLCEMI
jgi:hypothetical protein